MAGMLRSLIFQILSDSPGLAPIIAPTNRCHFPSWTVKTLSKSFLHLLQQQHANLRIFILLDGLDELEGDYDEQEQLLDLIKQSSQQLNVKTCVSSRPDPHLVHAFDSCPKLKLQDLTKADLQIYAEGRLKSSSLMQNHFQQATGSINSLVKKACDKAHGVFLWLSLATQDLLSGLQTSDDLELLHRGLELMDDSLTGLFRQLLGKIHPVHRSQTARYLAFVIQKWRHWDLSFERTETLHDSPSVTLLDIAFAFEERTASSLLNLLTETPGSAVEHNIDWCFNQLEALERVLLTRCAGLLDVGTPDRGCISPLVFCQSSEDCCKEYHIRFNSLDRMCNYFEAKNVSLIHRSALDFLEHDAAARRFMNESHFSDTEASVALVKSNRGIAAIESWRVVDAHRTFWVYHSYKGSTAIGRKASEEKSVVLDRAEESVLPYKD